MSCEDNDVITSDDWIDVKWIGHSGERVWTTISNPPYPVDWGTGLGVKVCTSSALSNSTCNMCNGWNSQYLRTCSEIRLNIISQQFVFSWADDPTVNIEYDMSVSIHYWAWEEL